MFCYLIQGKNSIFFFFLARKFDYFDESTMMGLQTQLFLSTQNSQHSFIDYSRKSIKFQPNVRIIVNKIVTKKI